MVVLGSPLHLRTTRAEWFLQVSRWLAMKSQNWTGLLNWQITWHGKGLSWHIYNITNSLTSFPCSSLGIGRLREEGAWPTLLCSVCTQQLNVCFQQWISPAENQTHYPCTILLSCCTKTVLSHCSDQGFSWVFTYVKNYSLGSPNFKTGNCLLV